MNAQSEQYIEVGIAGGKYAFPIGDVHEIIRMQRLTYIPNSQSHVCGVINVRGTIVPVVSLRQRFGMPDEEATRATRIVVVFHEGELVGVLVDCVLRVARYEQIQQGVGMHTGGPDGCLAGIATAEDGFAGILRTDWIMSE